MPISDVASDIEGNGKPGGDKTHDHETGEVDFVHVFGVEEEVGYAYVFAKIARHHGKKNNPAQEEDLISSDIIDEQLNREGVNEGSPKGKNACHRSTVFLKIGLFLHLASLRPKRGRLTFSPAKLGWGEAKGSTI
jgi:hypothetical protein